MTSFLLRRAGIALVLGALLFVFFTTSIYAAFLIPNEAIAENLADNTDGLDDRRGINGRVIDSDTECIGLSIGLYREADEQDRSPFWRSVNATSLYGCEPLIAWLEGGETAMPSRDYFRYWHGYLVFARPLLTAFDYYNLRGYVFLASLTLTGFLVWRLGRDVSPRTGLAFALPLLFFNVLGFWAVLTKAVTWWLVTGGALFLASQRRAATATPPVLVFFVLGALTAFLDYLTTPVLVFVIPFIIYALYARRSSESALSVRPWLTLFSLGAFFVAGWIGLWAAKIVLAMVVIGPDAIRNATEAAAFRLRGESPYVDSLWPGYALYVNFTSLKVFWGPMTVLVFIVLPLSRREGRRQIRLLWQQGRVLVVAALIPLLWLEVMTNHSQIHAAFTQVNFVPLFFLLALAFSRQVPTAFGTPARPSGSRDARPRRPDHVAALAAS